MLEGKVAIVTGAARGLGREFVKLLASKGAQVVAADVNDCGETIAEAGGTGLSLTVDVGDMASVQAMADAAVARFGRIDVLVNNAALYGGLKGGRFDKIDPAEWDLAFKVNVTGIWHCCKAAVPAMRKAGGGSIINIASIAAIYGMPYGLHYTATKAAVIGITRGLSRELGGSNIRVNSIAPTAVATHGTSEFFGERTGELMNNVMAERSLKRDSQPADIAGAVLWLASDHASFVTGQTIVVDGGQVLL
jgi:3-oxoacyl-[acyl-carrier protein] reductase